MIKCSIITCYLKGVAQILEWYTKQVADFWINVLMQDNIQYCSYPIYTTHVQTNLD